MAKEKITSAEVFKKYGIDPAMIGNRPRGWWIVAEIEDEEESAGASIGDLCVKTRDGGSNPICMEALKISNCCGTTEDGFDSTYRYYYFRALKPKG